MPRGKSHLSVAAVQIADEPDAEYVTTTSCSAVPDAPGPAVGAGAGSATGACETK